MQFHIFEDPATYYDRTRSLLLAHEDRYSVVLGALIHCRGGGAFVRSRLG